MEKEATTARLIHDGIIGSDNIFQGPFGERRLCYADWTASGRALSQVENYVRDTVLPLYANTHTETSITGSFTTSLRENARLTILEAVAGDSTDAVMFTGNGSTAAINDFLKLIEIEKKCRLCQPGDKPLVLISGYEHHSNILPWRECGADVLEIRESPSTGAVDTGHLRAVLEANVGKSIIIGSFSAGSNVTGICTDVKAIAILLHQYNALACFDYACVAPYLGIEMHWKPEDPSDAKLSYLDAVYVSAHKFAGGVGATGLLIANKAILTRRVPVSPGGGTVLFVTSQGQEYLDDIVPREEAGTPNIIGSIRAGLAFQVKSLCGVQWIMRREESIESKLRRLLPTHPNLVVLGPPVNLFAARRIPIISFLVKCGNRFLHHAFVSAVLNDVYGIQTRSGCMCAGPYAARLFGSGNDEISDLASRLHDEQYLKPGFIRLSLVYFNSDEDVDFIVTALLEAAEHAWKLLPQYVFDPKSGNWSHRLHRVPHPSLRDFTLSCDELVESDVVVRSSLEKNSAYYSRVLAEASDLYKSSYALYNEDEFYSVGIVDYETALYTGLDAKYSWFAFPKDVVTSAKESLSESQWESPCYRDEVFIRPTRYWPSVLEEAAGGNGGKDRGLDAAVCLSCPR